MLKHHGDAGQRFRDLNAIDPHGAFIDREQSADAAQQGRLAAA